MRALGVVLCLVAILVLAWLLSEADEDNAAVRAGTPGRQQQESAPRGLVGATGDDEAEASARTGIEAADEPERSSAGDAPPPRPADDGFTLIAQLVLPDRQAVTVPEVEAVLIETSGRRHELAASEASELRFEGVARARCRVEVKAAGFRHLGRDFDFRRADEEETERLFLWPDDWKPIFVRTRDGRPFTALATDQGWRAHETFVHAFSVGASAQLPGPADRPSGDEALALWHAAPGYQSVELPGHAIGSLQVTGVPPFWVSLWVHGNLIASQVLHPGQVDVTFELSLEDHLRGMARVRARLIDKDSGTPVIDAVATLKADTSAHRRGDLSEVTPSDEGELIFAHVMPGEHELTIQRGDNLVQERLELAAGEERDLGDIAIGAGPGIPLKVINPDGEAVFAWVEIAPYQRGHYAEDLYPPNLHRTTDEDGTFTLPVPTRPSVVRVRPIELSSFGVSHSPVCSSNALLDPASLPAELTIVTAERCWVRLVPNSTWDAGHRLTLEDELGIVVDQATSASADDLFAETVAGTYTVRRYEGTTELGSLVVRIGPKTEEVAAP
ncbi:MAG: hypothetical protein O2816_01455 [Planctomycetota bacterium]|nr:hypothetical protein [Planctomycetota bacterium]